MSLLGVVLVLAQTAATSGPPATPQTASEDVLIVAPDGRRQHKQRVRGRVVIGRDTGLGGVRVTLVGPDGMTGADSDADGAFSLAVKAGPYRLQASAPGLRLFAIDRPAPNTFQLKLEVLEDAATVRVDVEADDSDNPSARRRAKLAFQGVKITGLPPISPTLADLQTQAVGTVHPVAHQPVGALCIRTRECSQGTGVTVCCADNGDLTDEYLALTPGGIAGRCQPAARCPGARAHRRVVAAPAGK